MANVVEQYTFFAGGLALQIADVIHQLGQIKLDLFQFDLCCLHLGKVEYLVYQAQQRFAALVCCIGKLVLLVAQLGVQ